MPSSHSPSSASVRSPGRLTAMPSAIVSAVSRRHRRAGRQRRRERRAGRDLDADHLDLGPRGLHGDRDAGREPAAADRDDDPGEVRHVLEQLQAERALAGDDVRVVERVHERQPALAPRAPARRRGTPPATRRRRGRSRPGRARPRPWRSARRRGRRPRSARRGRPRRRRAPARGCPPTPRRRRSRSRLAERGELGRRAAHLERAGALQVLRLQHDGPAGALGDRAGRQDRRAPRDALDLGPRGRDRAAAVTCQSGTARIASISTSAPSGSDGDADRAPRGRRVAEEAAVGLVDRARTCAMSVT